MNKAPESRIGEMNIMDSSGHKQLTWHLNNPEEIAAMQATFDRLITEGYSAFVAKKKAEAKHAAKVFDPTMEEVVMVPRIIGG